MGLTVTTPASVLQLTTLDRVMAEIGVAQTDDAKRDLFEEFIRQATDIAQRFCNRIFARQKYTETAPAFGGPYLTTRQAPVAEITSATVRGEVVTDVTIEDAAAGFLYRQAGFDWTAQRYGGLLSVGGWLDQGMPIPGSEEPNWSIVYTAGFILPPQDLAGMTTISASSTDSSFNDSDSEFPALLKAGDIIETSGFTNSANNGRFVVSGTPTTAKIVVTATLVTEVAAGNHTVRVSNLPRDVERGCIEIVKSLYALRATDSSIVEKSAGPMRLRYSEGRAQEQLGLPPSAIGLLRAWVRTA